MSLACFALPMYVIRPFRHQGARELAVALFVRQIGPGLSVALRRSCLGHCDSRLAADARLDDANCMAVACLLAIGGAYLARVNVYELCFIIWMSPQFEAAQDARIDKDDMVLAVRVNGEERAYPIREMAYHHVVNDTVGRRTDCVYLLNALSHRSGVGANSQRFGADVSSGRHQ